MNDVFCCKATNHFRKSISVVMLVSFLSSLIVTPAGAQLLPIPGTSVGLTSAFQPPVLLGLKTHPENPLLFDFIVDQGQARLFQDELKSQTEKLVKYFLAALTIPDKEVWVNLSPTEQDRIIPDVLGSTTMGKTMLEQDYLLKQLAASLTNPDTQLGKKYWDEVNKKTLDANFVIANSQQGVKQSVPTEIATLPSEARNDISLNKVWIVPSKAEVLESNGIVIVGEKRLKVMMADEYDTQMSSLRKQGSIIDNQDKMDSSQREPNGRFRGNDNISSQVFRSTILPNIEK